MPISEAEFHALSNISASAPDVSLKVSLGLKKAKVIFHHPALQAPCKFLMKLLGMLCIYRSLTSSHIFLTVSVTTFPSSCYQFTTWRAAFPTWSSRSVGSEATISLMITRAMPMKRILLCYCRQGFSYSWVDRQWKKARLRRKKWDLQAWNFNQVIN